MAAMQFKAKLTKMEALSMVGSPADFKFEKSAFLLPPGNSENLPYQVVLLDFVHQQYVTLIKGLIGEVQTDSFFGAQDSDKCLSVFFLQLSCNTGT